MSLEYIVANWTVFWGPLLIIFIGIYGILTQKNLIKILISIDVMDLGVNLYIVGVGYIKNGIVPILTKGMDSNKLFVDPLPQALVLTAIVISLAVTAFSLFLVIKLYERYDSLDISIIYYKEDTKYNENISKNNDEDDV